MKPIFLYGFMGCGKSYIGQNAALETGLRYIDLDELIVKRENLTIPEIFQKHGEKYFRELEYNAVKEVKADIISLGGGALTNPKTAEFAKENALVVFIDTPFEVCYERIKNDGAVLRPLAAKKSKDELCALYESRKEHYKTAANYTKSDTEEIINLIKKLSRGESDL